MDKLLRDTVSLPKEILQGSAKQIDNLQDAAYNGSDRRLSGRTAATTLSYFKEYIARVAAKGLATAMYVERLKIASVQIAR